MKIIITGSLGHISKPLAIELIEKGDAVTRLRWCEKIADSTIGCRRFKYFTDLFKCFAESINRSKYTIAYPREVDRKSKRKIIRYGIVNQ